MSNPAWFKRFDASSTPLILEQGIILTDFTYINPARVKNYTQVRAMQSMQLSVLTGDVIVLTQSCELIKGDLKHVHLCPVFTFDELWGQFSSLESETFTRESFFEDISEGRRLSKYLTNICNLASFSKFYGKHLVAAFDLSFVVSPQYIKNYVAAPENGRYYPQLNPPYREALAQNFGFYYMRIGNPINYDPLPN